MKTPTHEDATAGTAAPSGHRTELENGDDSTSLPILQYRVSHIWLKAIIPGACIALEIPRPVAVLLTIDEARQLIGALASLIGDLEADRRALNWSGRELERIVEAADALAGSYASKL